MLPVPPVPAFGQVSRLSSAAVNARIAATLALLVMLLSACGSDSDDSQAADECNESSAREVSQSFITNSTFDLGCLKVAANKQFFFINNDDTAHVVATQAGAPETFEAELPKKSSTYARSFAKTGEYKIDCKRHNESMTLFVY